MTIPGELQRSAPRNISLSYQGWIGAIAFILNIVVLLTAVIWQGAPLFFVPFLILALLAAVIGFARLRQQWNLLMNGRAAIATVTSDVTPWWFRFRKRTARRNRRLQCEFPLLSGGVCKTTVEAGAGHIEGMELIVVYDLYEPKKALKYPARLLKIQGT